MAGKGINATRFKNPAAVAANTETYHWFDLLSSLYASVFRWANLPDTIDEFFMEKMLANNGCIIAYNEPSVGLIALPASPANQLNIYGYPVVYMAWGMNGFSEQVSLEDCCPCYDNILHNTPAYDLKLYANRLGALDLTINVNTTNQRTPYIYACSQDQVLSMKNMNSEIQRGKPAVFVSKKGMEDVNMNIIQTPAPYVADKLQQLKRDLLSEILNYMGVFSGVTMKAERVTSGENASNVGYIRTARNSRLNQRKLFCDKFNKKFGERLDKPVDVVYSEEAIESIAAGLLKLRGDEIELLNNYSTEGSGEPDETGTSSRVSED